MPPLDSGTIASVSAPETLGRLRRQERLGSGGFATVWRYHDLELDSDVAVKTLADNWASRMDIRERFLEEARILRRADADNVVRVYDIGETEAGIPYFVMSYADRGTVADLLAEGGRPTVAESVELIRQAGAGLSVLHRNGIIHRDVKPQNLLLRTRPDGGPNSGVELLVADLGVAKAAAQASGLTQVVGTPAYIAPEQAMGRPLDVRADVHALGAVAYQLLTGRLPREGGMGDLMAATLPPTPSSVADDVPQHLDAVVLRALAPDPDDRWPTVDAFVDALTRAAAGAHVTPVPLPLAKTHPTRREGSALRTVFTLLLVLLVLAGSFVGSYFVVGLLE